MPYQAPLSFTDQMNHHVVLPAAPKRIISLVPSQTELLFYLGLDEEVVGITKFCIHPQAQFKAKTKIGGTKQFHADRIAALKPDLLIGNKEENEQGQIEQLQQQYPVWMSDIHTLEDAYEMILSLGKIVDREMAAQNLVQQLQAAFDQLQQQVVAQKRPMRVAYFIWRKPYMVAANQTFINELLSLAGFHNVFAPIDRYPQISLAQLKVAQPEAIFLSSEPYPFKDKHMEELQDICPHATIKLVDGELFSWYGNRLLHSVPYFLNLRDELNL